MSFNQITVSGQIPIFLVMTRVTVFVKSIPFFDKFSEYEKIKVLTDDKHFYLFVLF